MKIINDHIKWTLKMNIINESYFMFIINVHFIWSFYMIIFYVHFLWSFISLSLRLPYSVCGRVCVWWGVVGKALIPRNKRKDKIRQHKRWQDKTEQGTRRLDSQHTTKKYLALCLCGVWPAVHQRSERQKPRVQGTASC